MKKYLGYLITAILGGLIAVGTIMLIFPGNNDRNLMQQTGNQDSFPVYQTSNTYNPSKEIVAPDFGAAADKSVHAVVHIKTKTERPSSIYEEFFGLTPRGAGRYVSASGSGVIISEDGYIVTNNHVVESAEEIEVTLNDKRSYTAKVVGLDPNTDLALIKIEESGLPFLRMGDSDELSVGEWVLAVGNPFNLTSTVTAGIVSAKARNINILGRRSAIESFIQTDAAVNRGNSGGALVNTKGELVGVNAAIASNTGSYTGYSFAIPANIARKVIADLKEYGMVQRAFIGVTIRELTSELAEEENIERIKGVYVEGVEDDGAADEGGIKSGDVIVSIDGKMVNSSGRLLELVAQYNPGDEIEVVVVRDNKRKSFRLTLEGPHGEKKVLSPEEMSISTVLGASFKSLSKEELKELGLEHGVQVTDLESGKLRSAGIREGFIITGVDREKVKSAKELKELLSSKDGGVLLEGVYPNGMRAYYGFGL